MNRQVREKRLKALVTQYQLRTEVLYHYTSTQAFLSIVHGESLWASECRYMNDAQELGYFMDALVQLVEGVRYEEEAEAARWQFLHWLRSRILRNGRSLFVVSLSMQGNQLSQWRSYTAHGRGVSIGFSIDALAFRASEQGFALVPCVYDEDEMQQAAADVFKEAIEHALDKGPRDGAVLTTYHPAFDELEEDILRLAATYKNPAFMEEGEWRLISDTRHQVLDEKTKFRAGGMVIVPYIEFKLFNEQPPSYGPIKEVIVGPTSVPELARESIAHVLYQTRLAAERFGVYDSGIPLRRLD